VPWLFAVASCALIIWLLADKWPAVAAGLILMVCTVATVCAMLEDDR
jgi:hypothetical protein